MLPTGGARAHRAPTIEADVCVVGAGPAGLAFSRRWLGTGARVVVLESGGDGPDRTADDLARAPVTSRHATRDAVAHGRRRQLGGTANLWLYATRPGDGRFRARIVPPERMDLEARPPRDAGWGIGWTELARWFPAAHAAWNRAPFDYRPEAWGAGPGMPLLDGAWLRTGVVQHGPADAFTREAVDALAAAPNVTIHPGHTVLELLADAGGSRIRAARVADGEGRVLEVRADVFVLAAGGIENAQLLLLSEPTRPGGPGNGHDVVGRHLTDHPEIRMATLEPRDPAAALERLGFYDLCSSAGQLVAGLVTLPDDVKRGEGLLNTSVALVPHAAGFGSPVHRALERMRLAFPREWPGPVHRHVRAVAAAPRDVARVVRLRGRPFHEFAGGWSVPGDHRAGLRVIEAYAATEQAPSPDNRVTLGSGRDRLGRRRARVAWDWSAADRANVERSIERYREAFEAVGLGAFRRWAETAPGGTG